VRRAVSISGSNDREKTVPITVKRETSTQKFKKGGRPKLRPE